MVSYTHDEYDVYTSEGKLMAVTLTSIRLDTNLADEAAKVLGVKSRTEAVHVALREIVALKRFKDLMRKHRGKLSFAGHDE
jgi:Arc/MetJ family transcription regulator